MTRLLLIRHAATDRGNRDLLVGSTDCPASKEGLQDLQRLLDVLAGFNPSAWFCSPLLRARQTVAQLGEFRAMAQEVFFDERLREIDFGRWEMKRFADITALDQALIPGWSEYKDFVFPDGEPVPAFCARVAGVLADLRAAVDREIVVVTHGGVIRTMICLALGLSPKNYLLFDVRPGTMTVIDLYPEGGILAGMNL